MSNNNGASKTDPREYEDVRDHLEVVVHDIRDCLRVGC